jgi:hypothetical protein
MQDDDFASIGLERDFEVVRRAVVADDYLQGRDRRASDRLSASAITSATSYAATMTENVGVDPGTDAGVRAERVPVRRSARFRLALGRLPFERAHKPTASRPRFAALERARRCFRGDCRDKSGRSSANADCGGACRHQGAPPGVG